MGKRKAATCIRLPELFWRYPKPRTNSLLEGMLQIDLGAWEVDGVRGQYMLDIHGHELAKLVHATGVKRNQEIRLGYGAVTVFRAVDTKK